MLTPHVPPPPLPAVVDVPAGRFTPRKLVGIGTLLQLPLAAIWSPLAVAALRVFWRTHPVVAVLCIVGLACYLVMGCEAFRQRSWILASLFCFISVVSLPWPFALARLLH
jgi:hypothetical protein